MVDWIPVVSQLKSGVQAIFGDFEGARKTQETFVDTCPIVSQTKSFGQWIVDDSEGAKETQMKFVGNVSNIVDGVPVVGHVKGVVHYACGDKDGGDNAMKSASRTVGVIGGGAVGGLLGGPVGAVAGGISGGALLDGITTGVDSAVHDEYRPSGQVAAVTNMIKGEATVGDIFDSTAGLTFDGISGYGSGKAAIKFQETQNTSQVYRVAGKAEVEKSVNAGKFVKTQVSQSGEYWVSESTEHTTPYYKSRTFEGKAAMKGKIPNKAYSKIKSELIDQTGSKARQMRLASEGKGPANIFNVERLENHPKGKVSIGIKGETNFKVFNEHVHGVREIHPDSWKYKNSFNRGVCRYGKSAVGTVIHSKEDFDDESEEDDDDEGDDDCQGDDFVGSSIIAISN